MNESLPLAVTRARKKRRTANAFTTRRQILAIHQLIQAGYTLTEISRQGWKQWGYKNHRSCLSAIHKSLKFDGFVNPADGCKGCGIGFSERTWGCKTCRERHWRRSELGQPAVRFGVTLNARVGWPCAGCGCSADDRTPGCVRCRWRHQKRKETGRRAA